MTDQRIRKIVVVGGGTAGWLSAAYLQRAFGETVEVQLIESSTIPRVGVGEATVPTLRFTMSFLGFAEDEWMPQVGATYKTAVRFEQWNRPPSEGDEHFYHPFWERIEPTVNPLPPSLPEVADGVSLMHYWHARHLAGDATPYAYATFPGPKVCDARKAPRFKDGAAHELVTAYHLDAHKFADFLARHATARGVKRILDDVTDVVLDEKGFVKSLRTTNHGDVAGDLFIDCSGFRSIILGKALKEPFISAAKYLWCDSAVATRPANAPGDIEPYTTARASEAGWMWNIPLFDRSGTGYVYSSRYKTKDQAEQEIRTYLGDRANPDTFVAHLRFTPGRYERAWVNNCIAVGLSANFIEPLESTTIFLIEHALAHIITFFPDRQFVPARAARYNRIVAQMYEEVRDFIVLHFVGSNRRDTQFWRDLAEKVEVPDSLAEQLEFYKYSLPLGERFRNYIFRDRSWACILAGMNRLPKDAYPLIAHFSAEEANRAFRDVEARTKDLVARLPGHREYLEHVYRKAGAQFISA